jgi:four helix bundle protein
MHNYKELKIWRNAIERSVEIYELIKKFPEIEKYNLSSQMRRSAVSVPSNIAEGAGRNTDKDFLRFLGISLGSCFELHTQLIISNKLKLITGIEFKTLDESLDELERMILGFEKKLLSSV